MIFAALRKISKRKCVLSKNQSRNEKASINLSYDVVTFYFRSDSTLWVNPEMGPPFNNEHVLLILSFN